MVQALDGVDTLRILTPDTDANSIDDILLTDNDLHLIEFAGARVDAGLAVLRLISGDPRFTADAWIRVLWRRRVAARMKNLLRP